MGKWSSESLARYIASHVLKSPKNHLSQSRKKHRARRRARVFFVRYCSLTVTLIVQYMLLCSSRCSSVFKLSMSRASLYALAPRSRQKSES